MPELGLWLDPREPKVGGELVFVSHAHSDHIAAHREVIVTAPTARLMQTRVRGARIEHTLRYGHPVEFHNGPTPFRLTLLPAGHILGSAMALIETVGGSLLYTGDFKLRRSLAAEMCEPRGADILIMETTFGLPKYRFPGNATAFGETIRFCREAISRQQTPVLLCYSLGKAQEVLRALGNAQLPIVLHEQAHKLTKIYENFDVNFPAHELFDAATARGKVILWPPGADLPALRKQIGETKLAVLTGWAMDSSCRYQHRADSAFVVSDHADFDELIEMVMLVQPKQVYTVHGFVREFAHTLRGLGHDAIAPGWHEQMALEI